MTTGARWLLAGTAVVVLGSLTAATLALVDVVAAWAVGFLFALPTAFFAAWAARELAPSLWRPAASPLRRAWRTSRFAPPAIPPLELPPPPPRLRERIRQEGLVSQLLARSIALWLRIIGSIEAGWRNQLVRRASIVAFVAAAASIYVVFVREVVTHAELLLSAKPSWLGAAAACFLSTFTLRAVGWQRLFRPFERPRSLALIGSTGSAAVAAMVFPAAVDQALSAGVLRWIARRPPRLGTIALTLFLLGLVDMSALVPFCAYALVAAPDAASVRVAAGAVAFIGVGAGVLTAALPSIRRSNRLVRYRLGHWLAVHAPDAIHDTLLAWCFTLASWLTRIAGVYMLLVALDLPHSFGLATAYVAGTVAAAMLPIGPAGSAAMIGTGAAILAGAGIATSDAVSLAVVAQALTVAAGATSAGFAVLVRVAAPAVRV